jgi:hypothetical protein
MALAVEAGEPDRAVGIAQLIQPERHPFKTANPRTGWITAARWCGYLAALMTR